jgi:hypothetical protein
MKAAILAAALLLAVLDSSCATLFQGNKEEIMVTSDPSGAQVLTSDGRSGTTPFTMRVGRGDDVQIHVSKAGYNPTDILDASHIEWGYFVSDFFFTGLIGLGVDGLDGAMFYHDQAMVAAHLEPLAEPVALSTPVPTAAAPVKPVSPLSR